MVDRPEIVYCENCNARIKSEADWVAYDDADLCAKCYQRNEDDKDDEWG